jgi:hypothetical protein
MKGVEPIIAAVLVILISVAGIVMVLEYSRPTVSRMSDISLFNQAKDVMTQIDNNFGYVIIEGEGSTRVLHLSIGGGNYVVDAGENSIDFSMDSSSNIIGQGVSKIEDGINVTGERGKIMMAKIYPTVDIVGGGSFTAGSRNMVIRNEGYDDVSGKQQISVEIQ